MILDNFVCFQCCFFFVHATAPTAVYTYCHPPSLHDALPIFLPSFCHSLRKRGVIKSSNPVRLLRLHEWLAWIGATLVLVHAGIHLNAVLTWLADRKSTRLNSSH